MNERTLTCVYCGQEYPAGTEPWGAKVLTDHIAVCAAHPMRQVTEDRNRLRAALVGLIGEDEPGLLGQMEAFTRLAPVPDSDKAGMLNAIRALIEIRPAPDPTP